MADLQDALGYFNTDKHQWYGWKNLEDGEGYSNLKLNDDTATMPSEEEVNAKIAISETIKINAPCQKLSTPIKSNSGLKIKTIGRIAVLIS